MYFTKWIFFLGSFVLAVVLAAVFAAGLDYDDKDTNLALVHPIVSIFGLYICTAMGVIVAKWGGKCLLITHAVLTTLAICAMGYGIIKMGKTAYYSDGRRDRGSSPRSKKRKERRFSKSSADEKVMKKKKCDKKEKRRRKEDGEEKENSKKKHRDRTGKSGNDSDDHDGDVRRTIIPFTINNRKSAKDSDEEEGRYTHRQRKVKIQAEYNQDDRTKKGDATSTTSTSFSRLEQKPERKVVLKMREKAVESSGRVRSDISPEPRGVGRRNRSLGTENRSRSRSRTREGVKVFNSSTAQPGEKCVTGREDGKCGKDGKDSNLPAKDDDPRKQGEDKSRTTVDRIKTRGKGRNTESFDPKSTLVRPDIRVIIGPKQERYGKPVKHDDVIMVPNFLCQEDDWRVYYDLVAEQRKVQDSGMRNSEWISWHEGAHLITKAPSGPLYDGLIQKVLNYFDMSAKSIGTRFNWYRDSNDWKPFHHDSAAFNPDRARNQNITVGLSLGSTRELSFLHAKNGTKVYFPQPNGMLFAFGRDVNILWKHGINALPENEKDGKGRISIVVWGLVRNCIEEDGSPPLLSDAARGNSGGYGTFNMHRGNRRDGACHAYAARGTCSYGNECRFSHG